MSNKKFLSQAEDVIEVQYTRDKFRDLHERADGVSTQYDPQGDANKPEKLRKVAQEFFQRNLYGDLGRVVDGMLREIGVENEPYGRPIVVVPSRSNVVYVYIVINDLDQIMSEYGEELGMTITRDDFVKQIQEWDASGLLRYDQLTESTQPSMR